MPRNTNVNKDTLTAMIPQLAESEYVAAREIIAKMPALKLPELELSAVPFNNGRYGWTIAAEIKTPDGRVVKFYPAIMHPDSEKDDKPINVAMQRLANERNESKAVVANVTSVKNAFAKLSADEQAEVLAAAMEALKGGKS